jgi:hypothetical protein
MRRRTSCRLGQTNPTRRVPRQKQGFALGHWVGLVRSPARLVRPIVCRQREQQHAVRPVWGLSRTALQHYQVVRPAPSKAWWHGAFWLLEGCEGRTTIGPTPSGRIGVQLKIEVWDLSGLARSVVRTSLVGDYWSLTRGPTSAELVVALAVGAGQFTFKGADTWRKSGGRTIGQTGPTSHADWPDTRFECLTARWLGWHLFNWVGRLRGGSLGHLQPCTPPRAKKQVSHSSPLICSSSKWGMIHSAFLSCWSI